jgi:hypothetical protein
MILSYRVNFIQAAFTPAVVEKLNELGIPATHLQTTPVDSRIHLDVPDDLDKDGILQLGALIGQMETMEQYLKTR